MWLSRTTKVVDSPPPPPKNGFYVIRLLSVWVH